MAELLTLKRFPPTPIKSDDNVHLLLLRTCTQQLGNKLDSLGFLSFSIISFEFFYLKRKKKPMWWNPHIMLIFIFLIIIILVQQYYKLFGMNWEFKIFSNKMET